MIIKHKLITFVCVNYYYNRLQAGQANSRLVLSGDLLIIYNKKCTC